MLSRNTPILTRLTIEGHGGIADATLYSHKKAKQDTYIPLKSSDARMADVTKYGGYSSVTTAYLFLVEHEIKGKKIRTLETVPIYLKDGAHDTSEKIRRQMAWTNDVKSIIWTEIVREKILKQAKHLDEWNLAEAEMLYNYINEIEIGDASNREGHAAKVYFNALFGKDFTRTEENSINAALNYGYGIILSTFNREIVSNGYITQIGLFHDNMFNQFNLGSDLMEPFRPLVDYIVRSLMPQKFEREEKLEILRILQQEVTIAGRREVVNNAIKIYCKSVFDALNEDDTSLIKFYKDEL